MQRNRIRTHRAKLNRRFLSPAPSLLPGDSPWVSRWSQVRLLTRVAVGATGVGGENSLTAHSHGNYHGDGSVVLAVVGVTGAAPAALLADGEGGTATGGSTGFLSGTPHSPSVDLIESFCFIEEVAAAIRATKSLDGSMSSSPKRANLRDAPGMQQQHSWTMRPLRPCDFFNVNEGRLRLACDDIVQTWCRATDGDGRSRRRGSQVFWQNAEGYATEKRSRCVRRLRLPARTKEHGHGHGHPTRVPQRREFFNSQQTG